MTKSDRMAKAIQQRDGLDCFLCGKTHTSLARMSIGFVGTEHNVDSAYLACTGCNKRRNNRPLGAYIRQRLNEARAEVAYIETTFDPANEKSRVTQAIWAALRRPIVNIEEGEDSVENPSLARDIQDVPWKELLSMDLDAFNALNKNPASEHERKLIFALQDRANHLAGLQDAPSFEYSADEYDRVRFRCHLTLEAIPCQWDGQKQHKFKRAK